MRDELQDSDRMRYMTPKEAVQYGLIDRVLESRKEMLLQTTTPLT